MMAPEVAKLARTLKWTSTALGLAVLVAIAIVRYFHA